MRKALNITFILSIVWQLLLFIKLDHFIWDIGLVSAWLISKGLVPYKDFSAGPYFPIPKLLFYPFLQMFNWDPWVTVWIALFQSIAVLCVIYLMSKKYLKGFAQILPIIYFSIWHGFILGPTTFDTNILIGGLLLASFWVFIEIINNQRFVRSNWKSTRPFAGKLTCMSHAKW